MAWVKMSSTEHGNADHALHAGAMRCAQDNLSLIYENSIVNLPNYMAPNTSTGAYHAVIGPVGTADTFEWATEVPPMPILARSKKGGNWRQIKITWNARVESTTDDYTVRTYLLPTSAQPPLDATGGILDCTAYDEISVTDGATFGNISPTAITPTDCGLLHGDGSVVGVNIPVFWVHVAVSATGTTDALYLRGPRIVEVI